MSTPLIEALKEIERMVTDEVKQPGDNEHRFKALLAVRHKARMAINDYEATP